jgi:glyoxylase-like metal-dependent hydrolase (beta-lactamase superfamily II)
VLISGVVGTAQIQQGSLGGGGFVPGLNPTSRVRVLPVRGNMYLLMGAGGNIAVSAGLDGVMMVDSGSSLLSDEVLAAIKGIQQFVAARVAATTPSVLFGSETRNSISEARRAAGPPKPIRYIVLTSAADDHVGGNVPVRNAGGTFTGGNVAGQLGDLSEYGAKIVGHENVQARLLSPGAGKTPMPDRGVPTDTYYGAMMKMDAFFNGEGVALYHQPAAYSDGDSIVYFRGSDVIAAGDVYLTTSYPMIDTSRGGTINGVIDALNNIVDMSVPEFRTEGGTLILPGHGRISDLADVAYYRDMTTILRDRVQDLVKKGMTLEQVKAAKVTADYDGRYGATTGPWTTDMFIEAVYKTLPRAAARPSAAPRGPASPR